jgi:hypothetical protein
VTRHAHYVEDLALKQLETALSLYFDGRDFALVITLAGAADEIFGKLLRATGLENSLDSLVKAVFAIQVHLYGEANEPKRIAQRANSARSSLKHWDEGSPQIVTIDLETEAQDMLGRAIDNW